ncbi:hypothetical protein N7490_006747 [Penicillium lividum]|nr:hypothetical protein N7490_006747 [Penicillium lividum]
MIELLPLVPCDYPKDPSQEIDTIKRYAGGGLVYPISRVAIIALESDAYISNIPISIVKAVVKRSFIAVSKKVARSIAIALKRPKETWTRLPRQRLI